MACEREAIFISTSAEVVLPGSTERAIMPDI
jgi:hypothetical protein